MSLKRERLESGIEILRLDRPAQRNAFDTDLLAAVNGALAELEDDPELRVLVFSTTSTSALSAGADVAEELDAAGGVARMEAFAEMYARVSAFPLPTICACLGHCVGAGAELAAGCDLRVAGYNMKARWVGALHGVPVGPARLTPIVGAGLAKDLVFSSRLLEDEEALRIGFVRSVHPVEMTEGAAIELAEKLASRPPDGMRTLKRMFLELSDNDAHVARENDLLVEFQRSGTGLPRR